jgi:hypothetical protein
VKLLWAYEADGTVRPVDNFIYDQDYVFLVFLLYLELNGSSAEGRKSSSDSFQCSVLYWGWLIYEVLNVWSDAARCSRIDYGL